MPMRWFVSSVRARKNAVVDRLCAFALLAGILLGTGALAAATSSPSQAPYQAPSQDFLQLPAYDLTPSAPGPFRVGDQLRFQPLSQIAGAAKLGTPPSPESSEKNSETPGWQILKPEMPDFTLALIKPGTVIVPSLAIEDAEGKAIARTNPLTLEVQSAVKADDPKANQPADLRPPAELGFPWRLVIFLSLVFALLLAGVIYGWVKWSRRQRAPLPEPAAPVLPPKAEDVAALEALTAIERQGWMLKGEYKRHYFSISEVLKRYLGARYRFEALESTTREIIAALEDRKLAADEVTDEVEALLSAMDEVKFTDHVPTPETGHELLAKVKVLVIKTRRPPIAVPASDDAAASASSGRPHAIS